MPTFYSTYTICVRFHIEIDDDTWSPSRYVCEEDAPMIRSSHKIYAIKKKKQQKIQFNCKLSV